MSKIKILETNKSLLENAQSIFNRILELQTEADNQIGDIKSIESKILDIEKVRNEKVRIENEKQARAEEAKKAAEQQTAEAVREEAAPIKPIADDAAVKVEPKVEAVSAETEVQSAAPAQQQSEEKSTQINSDVSQNVKAEQSVTQSAEQSVTQNAAPSTAQGASQSTTQSTEQKPTQGYQGQKPTQGYQGQKPTQGYQGQKPSQGYQGQKPTQGYQGQRPTQGYQGQRPTQGYQGQRPTQGYQGQRPGQGTSAQGNQRNQQRTNSNSRDTEPVILDKIVEKPIAKKFVNAAGSKPNQSFDYSKKSKKQLEDERAKRPKIKERVFSIDDDDFRKNRRYKNKKQQPKMVMEPIKIEKAIITEETLSVKLFSEKIGKPVSEIIKKLFLLGMMSTINSQIDFDTAALIAGEFDIELEQKIAQTAEDILVEDVVDTDEQLEKRPPIVTIMGHVDHGKTSLLDKIRAAKVTEGEAGGITQHIGAYQTELNGEKITFIDTPGHEAFTAMRARGAQVTDIAVIVVAADDGIMPQTVEAINHAKSAEVPIIVAVNKIDRQNANVQKIMQELTEHDLLPEEWGGETIVVPVSAKTGEGIDKLLEMILLVAEVQELKANPNRLAKGTIVEAQLDKGRGPVATVLVETGTLRVGDTIIAGTAYGRVRAMVNDLGKMVAEALPSQPVEVIGFSEVPAAGDILHAAQADKLSKQVAEERKDKQKAEMLK
ncbi:MAG: translation initiation factor IF-2, partial [Christensenella sp.]